MKKTITIEYHWNPQEGKETIRKKHRQSLEEDAWDRIVDQIGLGFHRGELCSNVYIDEKDGEDGLEYHGWWSID